MAAESKVAPTEDPKIDLFEDDDEFEEFEISEESPVLSSNQERKLQTVRTHPDKDLGVLLPKESCRTGGPSPDLSSGRTGGPPLGTSSKRKVNRKMIGTRLSSRSTPPSKTARVDNSSKGDSPLVIRASSSTRSHQVASPVVSLQPATSSATIATPKSSSPAIPSAPHSCPPCSGNSAGAPPRASPLLGNPLTIRERLERFVLPHEVTQIDRLGTEGVIDTFLEGLAQAFTASVCLLSMAQSHSRLKQNNENMQRELSAAQGRITALEAAGRALEADLTAARERVTKLEIELLTAHEREAKVGAELVKARERASLSEAELVKARERALLREAVMETEMRAAHERAS